MEFEEIKEIFNVACRYIKKKSKLVKEDGKKVITLFNVNRIYIVQLLIQMIFTVCLQVYLKMMMKVI